jgi:hypothetical protein
MSGAVRTEHGTVHEHASQDHGSLGTQTLSCEQYRDPAEEKKENNAGVTEDQVIILSQLVPDGDTADSLEIVIHRPLMAVPDDDSQLGNFRGVDMCPTIRHSTLCSPALPCHALPWAAIFTYVPSS